MRKIILYSIVLIATTNLFPISEYTINDVYLSLDGSWEFNISSMTDRDLSSALKNTIFEQLPDVSASLWLFNKFFFETHIENNNEKNLFLLGYQDNQSFLKEIRVGNDDLNISEYADFTPPINTLGAPGARIRLESENSKHEILARYSGEEYSNCKYIGFNQLEIENIKLNNYINGKFFIIPSDNVGNIELYTIEDGINTYIDQQDFIYYRDLSLLYIKEKQNIPIFISINNNQPVELYSPGKNSEYHFLGAYMLPTNSNKSTINVKVNEDKIFNYTIIDEYILFLDPTIKATAEDYRHPFKELDSQIYLKGGSGLNSKYEIEIETLTPVSNISIPTEAKQGTITIDLNGVEYFHFTYDSESRIINMNRELTPFDEISINYKTDSLLGTGNLLLSYGSRYTVFNNLMLDLSTTGSWDFSPDDYSSIEGENRGSIRSIGLIKYNNDFINSSIKTEIGVENPDTNGKYTLFNYGQIERVLSIDNISPDTPLLEDAIPFTLRSDNDLLLEIEDIKNLPINDIGGAYIINNIYEGVGYKALVLENSELLENQSSMVNMTLGELKGDYSWAKTFSLDILNQDIERTITINFTNSNLTESTVVLSKKIELDKNEKYKTYPVPFSRDDREKLSYIDGYQIVLTNSDSSIALIKNSCFSGDSIISVDTDYDYYLKKENSGFSI
ncbi:MAG: hypothetical protein B6229_01275 [Spirochaetaceae bacterium 4572_7]|nr:MAG: hypothetical protein B6229_01275 [Spirochaetaceae bacterium 4572_7]